MELGATMELLGGRGRSTLGKKTSLYSGGNNPTVTPHNSPAEGGTTAGGSGTTAPPGGTTVESGGQESDRPERYCRGGWAVLPLVSGTAALLPLRSTALSDTKMTPRVDAVGSWYRSGTTAEDPPAVLPLRSGTTAAERYCRL